MHEIQNTSLLCQIGVVSQKQAFKEKEIHKKKTLQSIQPAKQIIGGTRPRHKADHRGETH